MTYYEEEGPEIEPTSKPHNHMLYARNRANADDSITFVRRMLNPIAVRKKNAVTVIPSKVEDSGEVATEGKDYMKGCGVLE